MVSPRLNAIVEIDGAVSRLAANIRGLVQVARLQEFSTLTGTGRILLYGRFGMTAVVDSVLATVPDIEDAVGMDVVILSPNGRPADLCFIMGVASPAGLLYDGIGLPRTTSAVASEDAGGMNKVEGWRAQLTPPTDAGTVVDQRR